MAINLSTCTLFQLANALNGATAHYDNEENETIVKIAEEPFRMSDLVHRVLLLKKTQKDAPRLIGIEETLKKLDAVGFAQFKGTHHCWWSACCHTPYHFESLKLSEINQRRAAEAAVAEG